VINYEKIADEICVLMSEHQAEEPVVLDLRSFGIWTDFFVVCTAESSVHRRALLDHVLDFAAASKVHVFRKHRKASGEDEWLTADLGSIVVHIMNDRARSFYDLERLWTP
jgi:ribosome-associated protein